MCIQIAAQSPEARVNVWREGPSQSCRERPSFTGQTFAGEKNPHKRSSPPANIWPTRLGRTFLWGFLPVIYRLLVQNEPVNTWLIVLNNCSHWGLIYMRASQVFDQLPCSLLLLWCARDGSVWSIFVHCCVCMSASAWLTVHIECVDYIYTWGVWDETLTPHMHKQSGNGIKLST